MVNGLTVLCVLEYSSISAGIKALDRIVKAAPIKILRVETVNPGKYIILFTGDVASAEVSFTAGKEIGGEHLVDCMFVQNLHPQVLAALGNPRKQDGLEALGIVESRSVASAIEAGDIAAKEADIRILEIRFGSGMGGKALVKLTGKLHDVEAAMSASVCAVKNKGHLCFDVIIPRPHEDIGPFVI